MTECFNFFMYFFKVAYMAVLSALLYMDFSILRVMGIGVGRQDTATRLQRTHGRPKSRVKSAASSSGAEEAPAYPSVRAGERVTYLGLVRFQKTA